MERKKRGRDKRKKKEQMVKRVKKVKKSKERNKKMTDKVSDIIVRIVKIIERGNKLNGYVLVNDSRENEEIIGVEVVESDCQGAIGIGKESELMEGRGRGGKMGIMIKK
ncbi:UNVERIFIED_CONTAM: hypothetical protein DVV45_15930, partial [Lactiplantibacillus plantarum]|nr:hypothetical protein [Lactiplantibacillus plantarum]